MTRPPPNPPLFPSPPLSQPPADGTTAELHFSSPTAVYKGLAIAGGPDGTLLYASNFHDGTIDVFDTNFHKTRPAMARPLRSEEHTSELQSRLHLVCRLLLEK